MFFRVCLGLQFKKKKKNAFQNSDFKIAVWPLKLCVFKKHSIACHLKRKFSVFLNRNVLHF